MNDSVSKMRLYNINSNKYAMFELTVAMSE